MTPAEGGASERGTVCVCVSFHEEKNGNRATEHVCFCFKEKKDKVCVCVRLKLALDSVNTFHWSPLEVKVCVYV